MQRTDLRSVASSWLVGRAEAKLSSARLPRKIDVLKTFLYYHLEKKETTNSSLKLACKEAINIWASAHIPVPTQRIDACERILKKVHEKYKNLKKHCKRNNEKDRMNQEIFKSDIDDLFDIAPSNVMEIIKNEEDKVFLSKQREDVFSCSISGVDLVTHAKEKRKTEKIQKEKLVASRYLQRENTLLDDTASICSISSASHCDSDEEYTQQPSTSAGASTSVEPCNKIRILDDQSVLRALDRVNLPDRASMFVLGAVTKSLGYELPDVTLSRSSIRRSRIAGRKADGEREQLRYKENEHGPMLLHWDGKILPDIDGKKVDRIAVLVTENGIEQLLGIPKIRNGTGEAQANVCIEVIDEWELRPNIKGMVFDTTASNTGLSRGACIRIQEELGRELIWLACRHHVMEIILSDVFFSVFGKSGSPETGLFNRFKLGWDKLNPEAYVSASDDLFDSPFLKNLRTDMLQYLPQALEQQHPRDDYKEFLELSLLFLGYGFNGDGIALRAPGPTHHARWMAKGIYVLKIFLLRTQFKLTPSESKKVAQLALFISLVYVKYWNEAPLGIKAPYNDIQFLSVLRSLPSSNAHKKAIAALQRHLWYISESLVGFAFFDERVTIPIKQKMIENLNRECFEEDLHRVDAGSIKNFELQNFVTKKTNSFFNLLATDGYTIAQHFLCKPPEVWDNDEHFIKLRGLAAQIKVVNDCAERSISLMEKFNTTLTKDEEQKQLILRAVAWHRKEIPIPTKKALL